MADEKIDRAVVGMGLATVLAALALALPWWTATSAVDVGAVGVSVDADAGPFYAEGGVVETWQVVLVGVLAVLAFAGILVGLLSLTGALELHPAWEAQVPKLVYGGGALLLVGLLVAAITWPDTATAFWTSGRPGLGWYAGLVAALVGPAAMWDVQSRDRISGQEGDPSPGQGGAI